MLVGPLAFEELRFFIISMTSFSETGSRNKELSGLFFRNVEKLTSVLGIFSSTELPILVKNELKHSAMSESLL